MICNSNFPGIKIPQEHAEALLHTLLRLPWWCTNPRDYPMMLSTTRTRTAPQALAALDLDSLWPRWSVMDKFAFLAVLLAAAAPVLNRHPSVDRSTSSIAERDEIYAVLDDFVQRMNLLENNHNAAVSSNATNRNPNKMGPSGDHSDYSPDSDTNVQKTVIMTPKPRTRAAAAAELDDSPAKKKSRTGEPRGTAAKRKARETSPAEVESPTKRRRLRAPEKEIDEQGMS